ncbi:hypothetical protein Glove_151g50 [Diversispora epigaea]|uniref:Uncharacterized protein n=1 Tax=Diversispora epigaea TaxID=1348612 RepID=A0A397IT55_9GLOM|nr:hypothetical protein Glove_151g50 [Diversispora epigaea]
MNNYFFFKGSILSIFNQKRLKKSCGSTFLNFIFAFFSLFSLFKPVTASLVDESYSSSRQDVFDALINTLFPITFVILFKVSGKSGRIKKMLLPILDDILYNTVTWVIPLTVSFAYDDLFGIKIFSIINACLHVFFAILALIQPKTIKDAEDNSAIGFSFSFLIMFPVLAIPLFWIIYITSNYYDPINILFLTLFGILLALSILLVVKLSLFICSMHDNVGILFIALAILLFYVPNILQILLIVLKWPINFYFVKACVFILVLSLTRNVSYFNVKEVPLDFLATSTTITQWWLHYKMRDLINENKTKDETQEKILHNIISDFQKKYMDEDANVNQETVARDMLRNILNDFLKDGNV